MAEKNKDPAFLFYPSDFLTGTMTLDNQAVGAYIRLLCLQHQQGHLKKKDMSIICNTYVEHNTNILDDIIDKFDVDEQGKYYNARLEEEIYKRFKYAESRRNNRKGSINAKAKKDKKICKTYVEHMENVNVNINKDINNSLVIKEIVDYLNIINGSKFNYKTINTQKHINARLKENYTLDDFKTVIDKKVNEWKGTEMEKYLCPDTLFGTKFEKYLNQKIEVLKDKPKPAVSADMIEMQRQIERANK